jgi:hypothetical protein
MRFVTSYYKQDQSIWDGPKASPAVHGPSGITYHLKEKANAIADSLGNHFTSGDLCDGNHE